MSSGRTRPLPQKTIGVLGGMSDAATTDYYRLLNARLNAHHGGWDNAEVVVVSVNFGNIQHFVRNGLWDAARDYLAEKVDRLEGAGVDVVICATNTMHRVVGPIMAGRRTPFIHIVDPTGAAVRAAGLRRVALLGTAPTMRSPEMARRYAERFGVEVMAPSEADIAIVDRIIFDELVRRDVRPASWTEYLRVVDALRAEGAEGVILGCTEIACSSARTTCRASRCSTRRRCTWKRRSRSRSRLDSFATQTSTQLSVGCGQGALYHPNGRPSPQP